EGARAAARRMREREEREQRVFASTVDLERAALCECGCCPPRASQEQSDYCASLFSLDLLHKSSRLRDGLLMKMKEFGRHSCICDDPLFKDYILTEAAARSSAETFSMMSGEEITDQNKSYRYGAYRLFVAPTMANYGKGVRVRLPACFVKKVRELWPSNNYTGFSYSDLFDM
ncbi:hypothetical protein PENTCL1PPCAC_12572, partial [Pristionchus entomophagus]